MGRQDMCCSRCLQQGALGPAQGGLLNVDEEVVISPVQLSRQQPRMQLFRFRSSAQHITACQCKISDISTE
jgi:hypothetical protein